jgi:uncharacterized protein YrrD
MAAFTGGGARGMLDGWRLQIEWEKAMSLHRRKELDACTIGATDGDVGMVKDLLFDDRMWTIRYVVVATGTILPGRRVLISPIALKQAAWEELHLWADLTIEKVVNSPGIDLHQPVSRQHEKKFHEYYGYPYYWTGQGAWGDGGRPGELRAKPKGESSEPAPNHANAHLRSMKEVVGYHIAATDGEIGHVEEFLFDDETWMIRYLAVDTRNWWPGKRVLVSPLWIARVSWSERKVFVDLTREKIKGSPAWDPSQPVTRDYEKKLFASYARPPYWR